MAAGDTTCTILPPPYTEADIIAAVEALRVGASDDWLMTSTNTGDIIIVNIEGA